ncbi:MAG TPA: acetate--CoA ligase family protein [Candidatus Sulfotelmatobacter sp.]|nr:acetate--CoA ligase family protein [Candidatus Sulfotelmatobacter sp.]
MRDDFASLEPLFRPASIAIVGASADPKKIGGLPVDFLKTYRFAGPIYPVNPKADTIQGLKAYPDIGAIGAPIDQAVIAVPEPIVLPTLEACAKAGVRSVVIFTAGFAEVGADGDAAQRRLKTLARDTGMRMLGPNCIGLANFASGAITSFHPAFRMGAERVGRVGLVTQSGAFGGMCFAMARDRGVALSFSITTGNEVDVAVADCLGFLAEDPGTQVLMTYFEGCQDGAKLLRALETARRNGKPVIAMKVGRTEAGAAAAQSHTASLAGSDAVFDAVFRQYGVHRAETIEEFLDVGYACAIGKRPRDRRIGLVTVSGGVGILMADHSTDHGLEVAALGAPAQAQIKALVPFAAPRNPIDITGQVVNDYGLVERALDVVLASGDHASVVTFVGSATTRPELAGPLGDAMTRLSRAYRDTLLVLAGLSTPEFRATMDAVGVLSFDDPTRAVRSVAALARFTEVFGRMTAAPAADRVAGSEALPAGPISEHVALGLLKRAGVPVVETRLAATAEEAAAAARGLGFPVAVKLASPDVLHKTELGGVALDLGSEAAVREAFAAIVARAKAAAPRAQIEGCLVAPMVKGGTEVVLGIHRDPVFGPVVMFGLGGIFVEALRDVTFRVAPIDHAEARRMIGEIKAFPVLGGLRGRPPADLEALADALVVLSRFAVAHGDALESVDLNPVLVGAVGKGALALDAAMILRQSAVPLSAPPG